VLPEETSYIAMQYESIFKKRNIGICQVTPSELVFMLVPTPVTPLQSWLNDKAHQTLKNEGIKCSTRISTSVI
jgi:hypothetical protein